jgi:mono/diheme cytochrome c family protein
MRWALMVFAPAIASLIGGCALMSGIDEDLASAAMVSRGEAYAQSVCAACHGVGRGQVSARAGAPIFREIARRYTPSGLERELEAIAEVGHYDMPRIRIAPADRADLIVYVASLQKRSREWSPPDRGSR